MAKIHHEEDEEPRRKIVALSGGFDPIHSGHIRYIQEAQYFGDIVVLLNTDSWLKRKKGYSFQSWEMRADILRSIKGVSQVVMAKDDDDTVCASLAALRPDYFAKGGDRTGENTPEVALCEELGIKLLFNVGGGKVASSSELVDAVR